MQTNLSNSATGEKFAFRDKLFELSRELGFEFAGIASAASSESFAHFQRWIDDGCHAGMDYLAKNMEIRAEPRRLLPEAKSVLMLGVSFRTVLESAPELRQLFFSSEEGSDCISVAAYACGIDYHLWIRQRLKKITEFHRQTIPQGNCRGCVDTAPFFERQYAQNAGLGTIGRNTMLIHPEWGSHFFLAAFLTTEELPASKPLEFHPCVDCQRCQKACPNGALSEPFRLDARKCVNYWTIEHKGPFSGSSFGCDLCQNACPWNREKIEAGCLPREVLAERNKEILKKTPVGRRHEAGGMRREEEKMKRNVMTDTIPSSLMPPASSLMPPAFFRESK